MKLPAIFVFCVLASAPAFASEAPPVSSAKGDPITAMDPDYSNQFDSLYESTWGEGAIPAKYKQLSGMCLSIVSRCDECLSSHIKQAANLGATRAELAEAMRLGLLTGGSITIPALRRGYVTMQDSGMK